VNFHIVYFNFFFPIASRASPYILASRVVFIDMTKIHVVHHAVTRNCGD